MVLLHAGIGLLMFNELWVATTARERQVFLQEGQTVNYLRDIRTVELAIIDRSDKEDRRAHRHSARSLLDANYRNSNSPPCKAAKRRRCLHRRTSCCRFDVAVLAYYRNADVRDVKASEKIAGHRRPRPEGSSRRAADRQGHRHATAASIWPAPMSSSPSKDGKDLGTYLLSQLASEQKNPERFAEKVTIGDKTYDLFLRFKREYKPYTMTLVDVRKDDYVASDTPRNYSSDIRIKDPGSRRRCSRCTSR